MGKDKKGLDPADESHGDRQFIRTDVWECTPATTNPNAAAKRYDQEELKMEFNFEVTRMCIPEGYQT